MTNAIEPKEWPEFLSAFTRRNRGRRARFEVFGPRGSVGEEVQEAKFRSAAIDNNTVTVTRIDNAEVKENVMNDAFPNIRGVAVQYDTDGSEVTLELTNEKGVMTVLHFESMVDGDS